MGLAAQFYSRFRERAPTFFTSRFISWNGKHALLSLVRAGGSKLRYMISHKNGEENILRLIQIGEDGGKAIISGGNRRGIPEKRSGKKFSEKKREDWLGFLVMVSLAFLAYHVGTVQQKRRERWAKNVARGGTLSPERILRLHLSVLFCSPLNELRPREMRRGRRTHCWPMGSGRSGRVKKEATHI